MANITKRAEIDMVGYDVGAAISMQGNLQVRFSLLTYEDGALLGRQYHRVNLTPDLDVDAVMALVDADLQRLGFGTMPASDVVLVKAQTALIWTTEVVAAWGARQAAEEAEMAARMAEMQAAAKKKLPPWRFWAIVDQRFPNDGLRTAIRTAFANDPDKLSVAIAKLANPPDQVFDRDDPLFADDDLMAQLGLTTEAIDALWDEAWGIAS